MTPAPDLDDAVAAVLREPPDRFVAARKAMVAKLKADGDREGAATVAALRKPSVTAWAVNRLSVEHPDVLDALITAGDEVRAAQGAGRGAGDHLRESMRGQREAVSDATAMATAILKDAGKAATTAAAERITTTLHAVAADPTAAEAARKGHLAQDLDAPGFGAFIDLATETGSSRDAPEEERSTSGKHRGGRPSPAAGSVRWRDTEEKAKKAEKAEAEKAEKAAREEAHRQAVAAAQEADRGRREARKAAANAERLATRAAEADDRARDARAEADAAARKAADAERAQEDAERAATAAKDAERKLR